MTQVFPTAGILPLIVLDWMILKLATHHNTSTDYKSNHHSLDESWKFFTDSAKNFALGWLAFWSLVCFLSTTLQPSSLTPHDSRNQWVCLMNLCVNQTLWLITVAEKGHPPQ